MSGIGLPDAAILPPAMAPPQALSAEDRPRTVEPSSGGSLETDGRAMSFNSTSAVLLLVERSAQNFKHVTELLEDVRAASALTGATVEPSFDDGHVDAYA